MGLGQGKAMKGPNPQCLWVWHLAVVLVERLEPSHSSNQLKKTQQELNFSQVSDVHLM